eukprot:5101302-Pyramimonas_sp.AAC.1
MVVDRSSDVPEDNDRTITIPGADADSVWARPDTACQECMPHGVPPCSVHGSTTLRGARLANRADGGCRRLAAAAGSILPGQRLLHRRATHAVAAWLLAGPGWLPCPRVTEDSPTAY